MKKLLLALALLTFPAHAQDIPDHSLPVGGGPGAVGWRFIGPCPAGQAVIWPGGVTADPACGSPSTTSFSATAPITANFVVDTWEIGLQTPLAVQYGGTGRTSLDVARVLIGAGTGPITMLSLPDANVVMGVAGVPTARAISGDITIVSTGVATINPALLRIYAAGNTFLNSNNSVVTGIGGNTGLGASALLVTTTGSQNTAVGVNAMRFNTIGAQNTAVGHSALTDATDGTNNTVVGWAAGSDITIGDGNTIVGASSGPAITTGANNTMVGLSAGSGLTTGSNNTFLGRVTGVSPTTANFIIIADGASNNRITVNAAGTVAFPAYTSAGCLTISGSGTVSSTGVACGTGGGGGGINLIPTDNVFADTAGPAALTGDNNTAMGTSALVNLTSGGSNTAFGWSALRDMDTGNQNTAVGYGAGLNLTTSTHSVFMGFSAAGGAVPSAADNAFGNVVIGSGAGFRLVGNDGLTTPVPGGRLNTFIGYQSGYGCTTCRYNNAVGHFALQWVRGQTNAEPNWAYENTAMGATAALSVTTGFWNTAFGANALGGDYDEDIPGRNTRGITSAGNTAIGRDSMIWFWNGSNNTSLGHQAFAGVGCVHPPGGDCGPPSITGSHNTAAGFAALTNASAGVSRNSAFGTYALGGILGASEKAMLIGVDNIGVGYAAGTTIAGSASRNIIIGGCTSIQGSGSGTPCPGIVSGSGNVVIGHNVLGLDAAATNTITIADGNGNKRLSFSGSGSAGSLTLHDYAGAGGALWAASSGIVNMSTLPVTIGGTGLTAGISGGILCYTGTQVLASSAAIAQFSPMIGGGPGVCPSGITAGSNGQIMVGSTAAAPAFRTLSGDIGSVSNLGVVTLAASLNLGTVTATSFTMNAAGGSGPFINVVDPAGIGPTISTMYAPSDGPAAGDIVYRLLVNGRNDLGIDQLYARIYVRSTTVADPNEAGTMYFSTMSGGAITDRVIIDTSFNPAADGGTALGSTTLGWNGLHLNTGTAINWENGNVLVTHATNGITVSIPTAPLFTFTSTTTATTGPSFLLFHDKTNADLDVVGRIIFNGKDDAGTAAAYAQISVTAVDSGVGSLDSKIEFLTRTANATIVRMTLEDGLTLATFASIGTKIRAAGSAPAVSACGTSPPANVGSDLAGTVTTGTATPTSCTITFNVAYAAAPYCVVSWRTGLATMNYAVSTTAITLTQTATNSAVIDYVCFARSGG